LASRNDGRELGMKKWLFRLVVVTAIGFFFAAPYITAQQMKLAAQDYNGEKLAKHVDFEALRKNLTQQVSAVALGDKSNSDNPLYALGSQVINATVKPLVDTYVTPEGVIELMTGAQPKLGKLPERQPEDREVQEIMHDVTLGYDDFNHFSISINNDGKEQVRLVLHRYGVRWKLAEIIF